VNQKVLPAKLRIEWIDVARGLGIILVVYGHVLRGLILAGLIPVTNPIRLTDYTIYTFHMPLFFMLAGLNVEHSLSKGRNSFITGKLWTVAYPYLLWSLVQGSIQLLIPEYINAPRSAWSLATILWRPIAQFWFLYALFACHLIAWACFGRRTVLALLAIAALIVRHYNSSSSWDVIAFALPFYVAGIFLSSRALRLRVPLTRSLLATGIFGACFAVSVHYGRILSGGLSSSQVSLPAAVFGIFFTVAGSYSIVNASHKLTGWLRFLGGASLTIYVLHVFAASGTRIALQHAHLLAWRKQLILGTLAGILLPLCAHILLDRMKLLSILGLASRTTVARKARQVHVTELGS
jgi:fucose 4-O-acetylase-like acetyltransferase